MRRTVAILTLVTVVSMFGASDVRGGAAGGMPGKTTGASMVATIVIDVTGIGVGSHPGKGLTSIRVQRSGLITAAIFDSGVINTWIRECVVEETSARFIGKMDGWVPGKVLTSLFGEELGAKAVITDTDYETCSEVDNGPDVVPDGAEGDVRQILSFTAVIQFEKQ